MEIAALVSGGVDSSVMVPILKEQGFNPHIFYIKIGLEGKDDLMDCPSEEDIEITTYIAKKYGCSFDIVDLQKEYYRHGRLCHGNGTSVCHDSPRLRSFVDRGDRQCICDLGCKTAVRWLGTEYFQSRTAWKSIRNASFSPCSHELPHRSR